MRDFSVHLTHRPGEIARVCHALANRGVNLKSVSAMAFDGKGVLRLIADDVETARAALEASHIHFDETELVSVLLDNQAGALEDVADKLAKGGVNLHAIYVIGLDGDLVELAIACDDPKKAKKLVE